MNSIVAKTKTLMVIQMDITFKERVKNIFGYDVVDEETLDKDHLIGRFLAKIKGISSGVYKQEGITDKIGVAYLNNNYFNAYAAYDGQDIILINSGMVSGMIGLASRLINDPNHFTWIGDQSTRGVLGGWLVDVGLEFFFYHELAHVLHGHTRFVSKAYAMQSMGEMTAADLGAKGNLDRQTMEMDADSSATNQYFSRVWESQWQIPKCEQLEKAYGDGATPLVLASKMLFQSFAMMDEKLDYEGIENRTHPPAPVRMGMLLDVGTKIVARRMGIDEKVAAAMLIAGIVPENADFLPDLRKFNEVYSAEYWAYAKKLLDNWRDLRPQLLTHSRGIPLVPARD